MDPELRPLPPHQIYILGGRKSSSYTTLYPITSVDILDPSDQTYYSTTATTFNASTIQAQYRSVIS